MISRDRRIVEMQFDNAAFERGAAKSMSTLQKLKESLDFRKPVESLSNSFGTIKSEFDGLNGMMTTTANTFKSVFLGTLAGQTAYKGVVAGFNFIKKGYDATIGQIISGGKRRAQNIEQAKFQLGGLGINWDDIYEDLDYAVAGTAYGLDAAAKVGSQFVASGIKLGDDMKEALRGISGVAAMTNSSYEEIGNIFTTVAGQGKLMTMQLNQLAGRGLNVAGTLADAFHTTEANVRDMVTKGQVDFKTFAKAMNDAYGEHATKANDTFTGSLSNMKAALSRIGALFATPAYDNLRTVINATTPVINSFKKAITPVADEVAKLMKVAADLAATLLGKFNNVAFDKVMKPIAAFVSMITDSVSTISDTLTGGKVEAAADAIKKFSEAEKQAARDIWIWGTYGDGEVRKKKLKEAGLEYANVQEYLEKYVMTCNEAAYEEAIAAENAEEVAKTTTEAGKILRNAKWYSVFRGLGFNEDTTRSIVNIIETIRNLGIVVKNVFTSIGNVVTAAISGILGYSGYEELTGNVEDISLKMAALSEKFVITNEKAKPITEVFRTITASVVKTATAIAKLINNLTIAKEDFESIIELGDASTVRSAGGLGSFVTMVGKIAKGFVDAGREAKKFASDVGKLDGIKKLGESISRIVTSIKEMFTSRAASSDSFLAMFDGVESKGTGTADILEKVKEWIDSIASSMADFLDNKLPRWTSKIASFRDSLFGSTDKTAIERSPVSVFTATVQGLLSLFDGDKSEKSIQDKSKKWSFNTFKGIMAGIGEALADFDWKKLEKFSMFAGIIALLWKFNNTVKAVTDTINMIKALPTDIGSTLKSIKGFFDAVSNNLTKVTTAGAISVVALSVAALVMSLTMLADVPVDALARAVVYVVLIMGALKSVINTTAKLGNITKNINNATTNTNIGTGNKLVDASGNTLKVFDPLVGLGVMLFGLAAAVGVIYLAIKGFDKMGGDRIVDGLLQVGSIVAMIVGSFVIIISMMKLLKTESIHWSIIATISVIAASISGVMLAMAGAGMMMAIIPESKIDTIMSSMLGFMTLIAIMIGAVAAVGWAKTSAEMILSIAAVIGSVGFAMIEICAGIALVCGLLDDNKFAVAKLNAIGTILLSLFGVVAAVLTLGGARLDRMEFVTGDELMKLAAAVDIAALALNEIAVSISTVIAALAISGLDDSVLNNIGSTIGGLYTIVSVILGLGVFGFEQLEFADAEQIQNLAIALDIATAALAEIALSLAGLMAAMALSGTDSGRLTAISSIMAGLMAAVTAIFGGIGYFAEKKLEYESGDELLKLAGAVDLAMGSLLIIAGSLALLSAMKVKASDMLGISVLAVAMLGAISAIFMAFALMANHEEMEGDELIKMAASMAIMAGTLVVLAAAIALISKVSVNWGTSIGVMAIALGSIFALALIGTRLGAGIETIAKSLVLFAAAGLIFAAGIWVFAKATEELSTALPAFAEGLTAFLDSLWEHKGTLIAIVVGLIAFAAGIALAIAAAVRFGPAIESAFAVFINIATMITEFFSNMEDDTRQGIAKIALAVIGGLAVATPGMLKALGEILIKVMTFLGILINPLVNALLIFVIEVINGVSEAVKANAGPVVAAIMNLLSAIMILMSYVVKEILGPIINVINYLVEDALLGAEGTLWMVFYSLLVPFKSFGEGVLKIIAECMKAVVWLTEDDILWGTFFGTYHNGDAGRKNVESWLDNTLSDFDNLMNDKTRSALNHATTNYAEIVDDLEHIDEIANGTRKSSQYSSYLAGFEDFNTKVDNWGKNAVAAQNVAGSIKAAYAQLSEEIDTAEKALEEAKTPSEKASYAQMLSALNAKKEALEEAAEEEGEDLGNSSMAALGKGVVKSLLQNDSVKDEITNAITSKMESSYGDAVKGIDIGKIVDMASSGEVNANDISDLMAKTGISEEQAETFKENFMPTVEDIGSQFGISFSEGLESEEDEAEDSAGEVADYAVQALEDTMSDAEKAGHNFTGGFARGIWDNRDVALQNAWMVADRAANELARRLAEHSPSKVTAELGKFFTIGFANGIADRADMAVETTASLAERTTDAFRSSLQTISDAISSDVEANPTIRPVMDLTNVRDSVGSINSMFSSQSARYAAINSRLSNENTAYRFELDQSSRYDNSDVVSAIGGMQDEMSGLKDAMMDTQIVMDSGALVGQLAPGMDRTLGRMSARKARRN